MMKNYWLINQERTSCILFLAGWGMDPAPFKSVPAHNHDILMVYDYCQVEPEATMHLVEHYSSLHLVAWSMGVWIGATFFTPYQDLFATATAINGTLIPIDEQFGLPPQRYDEMITDFSPQLLAEFYHEMFDQPEQEKFFLNNRPERSLQSIGQELHLLKNHVGKHGPGEDIFTQKIVGSRDRIFPARVQIRSWGGKENCSRIKSSHFPFYDIPSWDMLVGGGLRG